ncbi:lipopolysaccharide assembly protein LapB [Marinomonas balearica]|uniref:Lipopolysaccharide assembly protein B n=1 Tax=Marinomonas balearica TaxID=491947 RepID=A0A4R6MCY2_9GAMM|nr:lipopolysaccharide assembly protein LapB [Marinomonas balearica]TDO99527.1 lipopolysaccharide biosynthesis regulator YciM [Marinomonas balearica]
MTELGLFFVLFVALFLGWAMGRRGSEKTSKKELKTISSDYFRGLNHLLNGQQSEAIDAFVDSLEVNSETFDIHLTLGNLFRKKGEIEKAINVHQNLLARPDIGDREMRLVQLELASDFMSAGLLDRAERLLLNIAARKTEFQTQILTLLIDLYEFEQSWEKAISISAQLQKANPSAKEAKRLAHFHCELAQAQMKNEQWKPAFSHFRDALNADPKCVRASVGMADVLCEQRRYRDAIKELKNVAEQDADFIPVILPQLKEAYQKIWSGSGYHQFLVDQNKAHASASIILALTKHYAQDDRRFAEQFLIEQLRTHPTIKGFKELIQMQLSESQGVNEQHLNVLFELIDQLTKAKHKFQCRQCGFSGHQLHWQCPSCKSWGSVKPIHGLEGE